MISPTKSYIPKVSIYALAESAGRECIYTPICHYRHLVVRPLGWLGLFPHHLRASGGGLEPLSIVLLCCAFLPTFLI